MSEMPVCFPGQEVFDRVRAFFLESGFVNESFNEMRGDMKQDATLPKRGELLAASDKPSIDLLRFFLGARMRRADFQRITGDGIFTDLRQLGLITECDGDIIDSTVRLRPFLNLYVLSDHHAEGETFRDDFVHAPDDVNTLSYLKYIPMQPCGDFLEACGGSGIAALLAASRCAQHAWSSDIAERSTVFAKFGAALSGVSNFTAVTGDTYDAVKEKSFDRITVHPPYVPVLRHSFIFHGGGTDGEQITRKHIVDLHGMLKPGGRLYCRCAGTDRKGEPLEQRIRKWLGEHESEYDIALQVLGYFDPWRFLAKSVRTGRTKAEDLKQWEQVFQELGLERMLISIFVIQRHDEPRPAFTARRDEGRYAGPRELEWLLQVQTALAKQGPELLLSSPLTANPALTLNIVHVPEEGDWQMKAQYAEVLHPHPVKCEVDPLSAYLLPKLDGKLTGRQIFASLMEEGVLEPDRSHGAVQNFGAGLAALASNGFLFIDGIEPVKPAGPKESDD
jgi:methylase of polypeptide subunit release factors